MSPDASAQIADHYLSRVDEVATAAGLPRRWRTELRHQLRDHLAEVAATATGDAPSAVLDAIHELGGPDAIVADAFDAMPAPVYPPRPQRRTGRGRPELAAVILVAVGWPFAGLGTLVGAFLLLTSGVWTRAEKLIGFAFAVLPYLTLSVGLSTGSHVSLLTNVAFGIGFLSPIVAAVVLWRRAGRRTAASPPAAPRPPAEHHTA